MVSIEIDIPADASLGVLLDCHLEFDESPAGGNPQVFKKNDALRVSE